MKKLIVILTLAAGSVPAFDASALPRGPLAAIGQGQGPAARIRQRIQNIRQRIQERRAARQAAAQNAAAAQKAAQANQAAAQ